MIPCLEIKKKKQIEESNLNSNYFYKTGDSLSITIIVVENEICGQSCLHFTLC